ncbi:MAG: TonB family protein [Proteobacteria bacterium]|nr:TonB family protein [Pseudomonadota bacterium]
MGLLLFALALAGAEPETAPPPAAVPAAPAATPSQGLIRRPDWIGLPNVDDLDRHYPDLAKTLEIDGRVVLDCVVTVTGTLTDCRVTAETPPDIGFGAATLSLASRFKMRSQTPDGLSVGGAHVWLPVRWTLAGGEETPWLTEPTPAQREAAYPVEARKAGAPSAAALDCAVARNGALDDCHVAAEYPVQVGVGAAALKLAPLYKVRKTGGRKVFVVHWSAADAPHAEAAPPLAPPPLAVESVPPTPPAEPAKPGAPHWIRTPSSADLGRYYPRKAMAEGRQGRAEVSCVVAADGHLTSCVVLSETPVGQGFGEASVKIVQDIFRISTTTSDGKSTVGAHVAVPIQWRFG